MELKTKQVEQIDHVATGKQFRDARIKSGKSLRAVAHKCGFSAAYLSDLEHGRRNWTAGRIKQLTRALKCVSPFS